MYINHDTYGEDEFKSELKKAILAQDMTDCYTLCVDFYKKIDEPFRNLANIGELHTIKIISSLTTMKNSIFVTTLKNIITSYIYETKDKPILICTVKELIQELRNEVPGLNDLEVKIDDMRPLMYKEWDPKIREVINRTVDYFEISDQYEYLWIHTK